MTGSRRIETTRFGSIDVHPDRLYTFPEGVPGLTGKQWALIDDPGSKLGHWLQSVEAPAEALIVVDPRLVALSYDPAPKPAELRPILDEGESVSKLVARVIVRAGEGPNELLFNLFAPIYFNVERHTAMQIPLVGSGQELREAWPPRPKAVPGEGGQT
jgi:flagellar assembly factor FliW